MKACYTGINGLFTEANSNDLPDHVKNNQYTFSPREGGGDWTYAYDGNGNMILKAQYNAADFTGDYVLNFVDVSAFTAAYQNGDMAADINGDGVVSYPDVSAFMIAFGQSEFLDNQHYT